MPGNIDRQGCAIPRRATDLGGESGPHNLDAEAALLGAMMIENRVLDDLADQLAPAHFYEPLHSRLYAAIVDLWRKDMLANPVTLRPLFEDDPAMDELGGVSYLIKLTGSGAGLIGVREFARQVRDLAQLRSLVGVGRAIAAAAQNMTDGVDPVARIEAAEALLSSVSDDAAPASVSVSFADAWDAGMAHAEAVGAGRIDKGIKIKRLPEWNEITGGMSPSQLILLGGRPGMSKTSIALAVGQGAAAAGHGVLFISREMDVSQLMPRMIADNLFEHGSAATFDDVLHGRLQPADWQIAADVRTRLTDLPLIFEETPTLNAARVPHLIRKAQRRLAKRGVKLGLVIVDYLGLLDPPQPRGNREQEIGDISRALKGAARSTGTAVLALAQLNRGVEQREDKHPLLSDLRDSGSLEQDADTVVFAYRAEYYLRQTEPDRYAKGREEWEIQMQAERDRLEIYSAKVRQGAPQRRKVYFFGARQAIRPEDYYRADGGGVL